MGVAVNDEAGCLTDRLQGKGYGHLKREVFEAVINRQPSEGERFEAGELLSDFCQVFIDDVGLLESE